MNRLVDMGLSNNKLWSGRQRPTYKDFYSGGESQTGKDFHRDLGGLGRVGDNCARMRVSQSEGYGYFFSFEVSK